MSTTELRPIPGHPGYLCAEDGSIWSIKVSQVPRPMRVFVRGRAGHLAVNLTQQGRYTMHSVHRLVALTWIGPAPEGHVVMHLDDVPSNNEATNLRYGLPADNSAQMVKRGRSAAGERHPQAKLTFESVREIRRRLQAGCKQYELAAEFGISPSSMSDIKLGRHWKAVA